MAKPRHFPDVEPVVLDLLEFPAEESHTIRVHTGYSLKDAQFHCASTGAEACVTVLFGNALAPVLARCKLTRSGRTGVSSEDGNPAQKQLALTDEANAKASPNRKESTGTISAAASDAGGSVSGASRAGRRYSQKMPRSADVASDKGVVPPPPPA